MIGSACIDISISEQPTIYALFPRLPRTKFLNQDLVQRKHGGRPLGLRFILIFTDHRAFNGPRGLLEIYVCPLQSQNLADPQPRVHSENRHEPDVWSKVREDFVILLRRHQIDGAYTPGGPSQFDQAHRITLAVQIPPAHGVFKEPAHR